MEGNTIKSRSGVESSPDRRLSSRYAKGALIVLGFAGVYRAVFFTQFDIGPDEAFYWLWSRRLDLGYVEHPPLIAYAIWLMRALVGEHPSTWRLLADVSAFGTGWCLFATGRLLFGARVGFWAAATHAASPVLSMACGGILVPESLLVFWVSLALYCSARLVMSGRLRLFLVLGVVTGCALLTKVPALLVPLALGLFALLSPAHRKWYRQPQPYLMMLVVAALVSPVVYWNAQHEWIGLHFITERSQVKAIEGPDALGRFLTSLLGQAVYHSPVLYSLLWFALGVGVYRGLWQHDVRWLLLLCFSAPVMVLFEVASAWRFTLPHWPVSGYLAAYVMLPASVFALEDVKRRTRERLFKVGVGTGGIMCALMPVLAFFPLATRTCERLGQYSPVSADVIEPMVHVAGWRDEIRNGLLAERQRLAEELGEPPVLLTHFHMLAAILDHAVHPDCEVVCLHAQAHQYGIWYDDEAIKGRPVLFVSADSFVTSAGRAGRPDDYYEFDTCTQLDGITVVRHGVKINEVHLWVCTGYRGQKAAPGPRI